MAIKKDINFVIDFFFPIFQMNDMVQALYISVWKIRVLDEGFLNMLLVSDLFPGSIDENDFGDRGELVEKFFY